MSHPSQHKEEMSNILFKDTTAGSPIYALIKGDNDIRYIEGSIVTIGQQRVDVPPVPTGGFPLQQTMPKTVVDVTYSVDGKNYTDAVDVAGYMFSTEKLGDITLLATDKEPIVRELRATLKKAEDYLRSVETEVPRNKKRITACKKLIGSLDTAYAEKQEIDSRIKRLEESNAETNKLLNQILTKLK